MSNSDSLQEKVIKGSLLVIVLSLLGSVFAYIIRVLYSRILSIEDYGLFYAVFGFFSIISTHTDLGFGEAISYFAPKYLKFKKYNKLWNTFIYGQLIQVTVAILISGILIILAPILSLKYFKVVGSETLIYILCAFLIINSILNSLSQIFTGLQRPKYFASINVFRSAFVLFFSYVFLILGFHTPIFYALAWVLGYFITTLIFLYLLCDKYFILTKNNLSWQKNTFNTMYKYAVPAFATTLVYSLLVSSDIFFLTLLRGIKEVAVYNIVLPIVSISIALLSPLNSIIFPLVSHLCEGEREKLSILINKIYQVVPFVGVYFALFIILFPSSIVGLIFGQKWLGFTQIPLSFLALGYIAYLFSIILGIITLGTGQVNQRLKILIFMAVLSICLHAVLIYKYGILGAVITNSLIAILLCLIFTKVIRSVVIFKIPTWLYIKLLFLSFFTFFIIRVSGFTPHNWSEFILSGVAYTSIFAYLGFLFKIYDKKSLELILPLKKI